MIVYGMDTVVFYQIGSVIVSIEACKSLDFWNTWKWKIDPYRISLPVPECDLSVSLSVVEDEWLPKDLLWEKQAGFFNSRVFSTSDGRTLWEYFRIKNNEVILRYTASSLWDRITLLQDHSKTSGHLAFEYLGQMIQGPLLKHGILTFHGVLMEHQGYGIIISAFSGTGKTTHARLWRDYRNALIINGDRASCCVKDGTWTGFGLPWSGTSGEQINRSVPLKALVVLERGSQNEAHRIMDLEAFGAVLPHLQYPAWNREMTNKAMAMLDQFLRTIPVIRLRCRPDLEAVHVLYKSLEEL